MSLCIQFGPQQQGTVVNPVAAALCALIVYSEFLIHPMVLLLMIGGDTAIKIKSDNGLETTRLYNYVSLNQSFKLPSDFVFLM